MLLSPYLHPKLRFLGTELYKSPHVNARCTLVYIPSLVGGAYVWAAILRKGNRAMHSEVAPYNHHMKNSHMKCLSNQFDTISYIFYI